MRERVHVCELRFCPGADVAPVPAASALWCGDAYFPPFSFLPKNVSCCSSAVPWVEF